MPDDIKQIFEAIRPRLGRMFNSLDPTLEANLAAYVFGVIVMAGILIAWTINGNRDTSLVGAMGVFAAAITGGLFKKSSATEKPGDTK